MKKNNFNKQLDIKNIRSHFPIFDTNKIVYLDTAASAQKPYKVIKCIEDLYSNSYANVHRGVYSLSQKITDKYEQVEIVDLICSVDEKNIFILKLLYNISCFLAIFV